MSNEVKPSAITDEGETESHKHFTTEQCHECQEIFEVHCPRCKVWITNPYIPVIRSLQSRLERAEVDLHSYRFDADRMFHALKILSHVDDGQESNGTDTYVRGVAKDTIASLSNQYPSE